MLWAVVALAACDQIGGAFDKHPVEIQSISAPANALIRQSIADIDRATITDYHIHIVGLSPHTIGTFVNESWQSLLNPPGYVKFGTYKSAAGVHGNEDIDGQFLDRLNSLINNLPYQGRFGIMAFDYFHNEQGEIDKRLTTFLSLIHI